MRDIMTDLETLGTTPGSVFFALGAVPFDRDTGQVLIEAGFYQLVSIPDALAAGLTRDPSTIEWWGRQKPEAQAEFWKAMGGGDALTDVIDAFDAWLAKVAKETGTAKRDLNLWGNGVGFDNIILAAACRAVGCATPWNTFNDRCFRSLKADNPGLEPEREGIHHHALWDAIYQARWAAAIYRKRAENRRGLTHALRALARQIDETPMSARARNTLDQSVDRARAALVLHGVGEGA